MNIFRAHLILLNNRYKGLFVCEKCGVSYQRLINICEKCGEDMNTEKKFKSYVLEFRENGQKCVDELARTNIEMATEISNQMTKVALKLLGG